MCTFKDGVLSKVGTIGKCWGARGILDIPYLCYQGVTAILDTKSVAGKAYGFWENLVPPTGLAMERL